MGHAEVAQRLLDGRADVDHQNHKGATALHVACQRGHVEVVRLLLDRHASVDLLTESGLTALRLARRHPECMALFEGGPLRKAAC
mmetsp:Transcript_18900/g.41087  ORF Transcript_18900/g.41087 Transcript_18900/m.41087 type:complete len:85 (-) Transcript_18900:8-262(-)